MNKSLETIKFEAYPMGQLFPEDWKPWIFDAISDNAPFSWGDNDHTLISADRFEDWFDYVASRLDECDDTLKTQVHEKLEQLKTQGAYIELEN